MKILIVILVMFTCDVQAQTIIRDSTIGDYVEVISLTYLDVNRLYAAIRPGVNNTFRVTYCLYHDDAYPIECNTIYNVNLNTPYLTSAFNYLATYLTLTIN